jgi:hypothetical protein
MSMNTDDLTRALRDATDDIEPRIGFTTDVLRGGRRRQNRHRVAIAGGMAALLGVTGTTVWTLAAPGLVSPPGQTLDTSILAAPTKGDLAGDQEYLAKVIEAWRRGLEVSPNKNSPMGDKLTGSPKVLWAGTTSLGRAAIVGQSAERTGTVHYPEGTKPSVLYPAFGLVTGDEPTLVNESPPFKSSVPVFLFGPADRALITLDRGPRLVTSRWVVGEDGKGTREWQPIPVTGGVAITSMPEGTDPRTVRVREEASSDSRANWSVLPSSTYAEGWDRQSKPIASRTLDDWLQEPLRLRGATRDRLTEAHALMAQENFADPLEMAQVTGFEVITDLPDGRTAIGFEYAPDFGGSRFYAMVVEHDGKEYSITYGGKLDKNAVLPARVELPDEQGWLVAHYGASLRFRTTPNGLWTDAGLDAALLPRGAIEVEVTKHGKPPQIATL